MGKRNKGSFKKRGKIHRHRCKGERNTLPSKNRNARLAMSADPSTCQGRKKRSSNVAAAAPQNNHLSEDSPTRAYHNWQEMMQRKHSHLSECAPSIALAAFFQYYHFDGNRSCVQQNCEVFEEFCRDAMIDDEEAKSLVCNLLGRKSPDNVVTWSHDDEANLLQDVDLVVLAAPPDEYKHYTQLLRHEYANLDDATYKLMRVKVLETLLLIPCIYATAEYHDKYEELARANISNEISELKK